MLNGSAALYEEVTTQVQYARARGSRYYSCSIPIVRCAFAISTVHSVGKASFGLSLSEAYLGKRSCFMRTSASECSNWLQRTAVWDLPRRELGLQSQWRWCVRATNLSHWLAESFALKRSCSTALSFPRNAKDYRLRNVVINRATTPGRCVETGREMIRTRPYGASENRFIRFHFTGEKALCLFWSCRIC
jgi:hypothetical protein